MPQSKSKRSRYTPPPPKKAPPSPLWYGIAITTLLALGLLVVVTNYIGLLPGEAENRYLIVGLVLISGGVMMATGYHCPEQPESGTLPNRNDVLPPRLV